MKIKHINSTVSKLTVLRQLCNLIPAHLVGSLAVRHHSESHSRTFSHWSHIVASGDIHPLSKRTVTRLLQNLPVEYLSGLSRIELRARQGSEIGRPFGCYWLKSPSGK